MTSLTLLRDLLSADPAVDRLAEAQVQGTDSDHIRLQLSGTCQMSALPIKSTPIPSLKLGALGKRNRRSF